MSPSRFRYLPWAGGALLAALVLWQWFFSDKAIQPVLPSSPAAAPAAAAGNKNSGSSAGSSGTPSSSGLAVDSRKADTGPDGRVFLPDVVEQARRLNDPKTSTEEDISVLQDLLAIYRGANGGNPTGENRDIVRQLSGQNPKRFAVLPPDLSSISQNGELVDRWGSPYFFHALSRESMEIHSAGEDRILWTKDDFPARYLSTQEKVAGSR